MDSFNSPTTKPLYRGTQIVWYILGIIEIFLAFRFFLKLFAANSSAGFTSFIYGATNILTSPFSNVFHVTYTQGNTFEWTTLLAMLVYYIIALGIVRLFFIGKTVSTPEAAARMNEEKN